MLNAIWLALFLPLIGFLMLLCTNRVIGRRWAGFIACGTVFISFLCFVTFLYTHAIGDWFAEKFILYNWIPVRGMVTDFTLNLDSLSLLMGLIITGVGFLIHVYSIGYMDHEEDIVRYFAFLNFFIFSMLLLVLAENLLVLFVGWEGVGLASYLLIGFWYQRPAAAQAATKAFVVNRIGDLGLLLGIILTYYLFGTSDIQEISSRVGREFALGAPIITVLSLLYFWGATGKSAQLPLYTWLPDAMEGPTPVSALIHAATMVTAGVYLVVRMHAVFLMSPIAIYIVGVVGGVTALLAALAATSQVDLKRVLAYSTISQLGLMFLACGVGAFYAAMFHLTTHAFIKGLLFLAAGNVVHMMHGTTDMRQMGGLSKTFTKTQWLFLIGVLGLSGIPPFAAFFSKDLILEQEFLAGSEVLFIVGLCTSILTAFYLTRAYFLTFRGESHVKKGETIEEAPSVMITPVSILALLTIVGGLLGIAWGRRSPLLEGFLAESDVTLPRHKLAGLSLEEWLAIGGAFLGVGLAAFIYSRYVNRLGSPIAFLQRSFYTNEIYWTLIGRPLESFSRFIARVIEPKVFTGSIQTVTDATQNVALKLQQVQSGQIRSYAAWMVVGAVALIIYLVF